MLHRLAILIAVATAACAPPNGTATPRVPESLPREPVVTLAGEPTDLARVAEGRVALVSFWATWCEACTKEIDSLNRLAARATARGDALVIGIAVGEARAKVDTFVRRHGIAYPQLVDEDFRLADALGQQRVPATLVVDRSNRVVYRGEGLDGEGLAAFRKALGEAP
jgi:peroxiredoxin